MSNPPRTNRDRHRERNGDHRDHREHRRDRRDPNDERRPPSSSDRSSSQPPYYSRDTTPPPKHVREVPREEERQHGSCTNVCSRRGIVLIISVLTNALVLVCVVAAQMVTSGLSAMGGLGGISINSNFNMQGTELQTVRDLDMQYSQMRAPGIYGGIAFSLTFGVLSLLFVVSGNKLPHLTSQKVLVGALVFQAVGAVVYVVAVGLYLHFITRVNATDVCQRRERLYARNGYTWMNCDVSGADAAVAMFGLITAILYAAGTVLTFQTVRGVRRYLRDMKRHHEAERRQAASSRPQRAPLRAETTNV